MEVRNKKKNLFNRLIEGLAILAAVSFLFCLVFFSYKDKKAENEITEHLSNNKNEIPQVSAQESANSLKKLSMLGGLLVGHKEQDIEELLGKPDINVEQKIGLWKELYYFNKAINDVDNQVCSIKILTKKDDNDIYSSRLVRRIEPVKPHTVITNNIGDVYGTIPSNQ